MNLFQYITLDDEAQESLDSCLPSPVSLVRADRNRPEEELFRQFLDCEIAFGNIPAGWIEKSSAIKWLQLESVGYESYLSILQDFNKRGTITNLHGFFGQPVAESALAGLLSLKRGIDKLVPLKEKKEWQGNALRPRLTVLHKAVVLIAGGGNIGQSFKKIISGFDPEVVVYDKNPLFADITTAEAFDRQLEKSDIVFSCLPDSPETKHFFNEERFRLMPESAIFINVGRGSVVDETSLTGRLNDNKIAGAVLDVTHREPLLSDDQLWDCPNLILTQHTGGGSKSELKGKVFIFLENLDLYLQQKPLKRTVK
jgi:phosphoglycerate dehydrogenase-like enzyme